MFGIDRLLADPALRAPLEGKRVALARAPRLGHPRPDPQPRCAGRGGHQHHRRVRPAARGAAATSRTIWWRSPDYTDPTYGIPVFSLYGEVRRPTGQTMGTFDVVLVDLQDLGCRIYTFVTTLLYMLEAAAEHGKAVWVLDRPNPAGRPVEGTLLRAAGKASSARGRCRCATA